MNMSPLSFRKMFLDPIYNDQEHRTTKTQAAGFDVGVLIREVRFIQIARIFYHYPIF